MTPFSRAALTRTAALAVASSLPTNSPLDEEERALGAGVVAADQDAQVCSGCQSATRTGVKPCSSSVVTAERRAAFWAGVIPVLAGAARSRRAASSARPPPPPGRGSP